MNEDILRFDDPPENKNGGEEDILYFDDVKDNQDDEDILYFDDVEETEKFRNPFTSNQNLDKKEVEIPVEETQEPIEEVEIKKEVEVEKEEPNFFQDKLARLARGILSTGKGLEEAKTGLFLTAADFAMDIFSPEIKGKDRSEVLRAIKMYRDLPIASGIEGYDRDIKSLGKYISEYDSESIVDDIIEGRYGQAADRAVGGVFESAPSLALAFLGPGGLITLGTSAAGNKFDEEFEENPEEGVKRIFLNSALSGAAEATFELVTRGILGRATGLIKSGNKQAAKELIDNYSTKLLKRLATDPLAEGVSEAATEFSVDLIDLATLQSAGDFKEAIPFTEEFDESNFYSRNWKKWSDAGIIGTVTGGGIVTTGALTSNDKAVRDAAEYTLTPESDKKIITNAAAEINNLNEQIKQANNKEEVSDLENMISEQEQIVINTRQKVSEELNMMNPDELKNYAEGIDNIAKEKRKLNSFFSPILKTKTQEQINELQYQNDEVLRKSIDRRLDENIKTVGVEDLGRTVNDYNSKEDYQKAYDNTEQGKKNSMNVTSSDGFISEDGDIYINREVAQKVRNVNVAAHELLHGILNNNIKEPGQLKKLVNEFKAVLPRDVANKIQKRIDDNYRFETDEQGNRVERPESEYMEEYFTAFADLIGNRQVKFNENIFTKIGEKITPIFKGKGYGHIKFETGKDVYNFIKDYQKQIAKGELKPETIEAAKKITDQDVKNQFSKTIDLKKQENQDKLNDLVGPTNEEGFYIVSKENFKGSQAENAVRLLLQTGSFDELIGKKILVTDPEQRQKILERSKDEIEKHVARFNPTKNKNLFGYINSYIQDKVGTAAKTVLREPKTVPTSKKIGGEDSKVTVAETLVSDEISPEDYTDMKLAQDKLKKIEPQQSRLVEKLNLTKNEVNLAKRDIIGFLRKTNRPAMTDPKKFFKAFVDYTTGSGVQPGGFAKVIYDKLSLPKDGRLSTKNRKAFIKDIAEDLIALNKVDPAVMRRSNWKGLFYDVEIENMSPTQTQKAIDEGRVPSTTNLNSGLDLFKTLDPSVDQVVDYLMKIRPDVFKRKMPKFLGEVIVKNEFNEILENPVQPIYDAKGNKTDNTIDLSKSITEEEVVRGAPKVIEKIARPKGIKFSLTTKKDLNWKTDEAGNMTTSFRVNNKKYNIELYPVDDKGDYRLNFNLETKNGTTREITATGDSFKVFSIVYNGIVEEIESNLKIKSFQFEADKSEPTRVKLYTTLMNRLADRLGWESDIYETTDWDGGGSFDFELVKPKIKNTVKKELDKINKSKSKEKKSGKEELDMIVDAQGLANIRGDVNSLRSVMFMVADKAKKFGLDGINKILMPGNLTSGNRIDLLRKFGFNVISNPDKIKDTKLRKQAYQAVKEGEFLNLSSVLKEVTKGVKRIKNNDVEAFQIALGAKSGEAAKRNASRKNKHDRGVKLVTELELDIFLESVEGEAFIRLIGHNDKLNKNGSRNQALPNSVEVGATVNGKRRSETTDEHQWQANEWVKGKLKLFKNIKNNVGTKQEKVARKALDLYLDLSKDNYTQFLLKNETDIIKGDLTNNKGKVWKKSGSTLHPILKEKLNNFIELASKKGTTEEQLQKAFNEIPSADIRYFSDYGYVNPNFIKTYKADGSYTTKAEEYNVVVPEKFKNDPNVRIAQGKIIETIILTEAGILTGGEAMSKAEAKQAINEYLKIAPEQQKASKFSKSMLNDSKVLNLEGDLSMEDLLSKAATLDNALANARKLDAPVKKIRVFDFDDTLARTKSIVFYTKPDGSEGQLTAEEFAEKGADLVAEGAVMDFSDFNIVREGKRGPLFDVAKKIRDARGNEDLFVLTARAPESADAIYEFLKSEGLEFKRENIVGLGNSTGAAKANWIVDKAANGYNDFYFADDAYANVKAVQDALDQIDVKSKVQQAKVKFSKSINEDFNKIIEQTTGIASEKRYSKAKAKVRGANKGNKKFFIPYSAEDFMGLVYPLLSKGKLGDSQMAWFKEHLLDPYGRAIENLSSDRIQMMQDFKQLKKSLEVPKDLRKTNDSGFTNEQAVRVYLFNKMGYEVPGLSKTDLSELVDVVNSDGKLKAFADQILSVTKGDGYVKPSQEWLAGTITTDLIDLLNTTKRRKYLEQSGYLDNANEIFSTENLNKLEAAYGAKYREAVENTLSRMKSGKNRMFSGNRLSNRVLDYINGSIGTIMFFNTRSAVLQTISAVNFLNWSFNNPYKAGKAFANQPQYWKDFKTLMNSDYLTDRRNGLKLNISENEIANAAATAKNKARGAMNYILQKGYLPTQFADSFAIASGGATFYRNRINDLVKQGVELKQAEKQALSEWKETAEISQQSSDPSKISQQQASDLGRVILAFANTPMQYARIQKRAFQDLVNKRGDAKTHVSKIIYYGIVQNLIFNALQQALFAIGFGDDEDDENEKKYLKVANGMLDSTLRGLGIAGATVAVIKNFLMDIYERSDRPRPEYVDAVYKLLQLSPPISSKISKIRQAAYQFDSKKRRQEIFDKGFNLDNPAYEAATKVISATTNLPLDRVLNKVNNIEAALSEDAETWQTIAMLAGWPEWQIMAKEKKKEELPKFEGAKVKEPKKYIKTFKKTIVK